MAVWGASGALLLVMLTGASYSYPAKQGFDPSSSSSSYGAKSASAGYNWEVPSSGGFAPAAPGSGAGSKTVAQPSVQRAPAAASYSSNSLAAPSGYASSSSAGPSSLQPSQDIAWAVAPPRPLSGEETSSRRWFASSQPAPEPLGPSNVGPPGPFLPEFQAGELSQIEDSYEHGNYESETEDQGFQPPPPGVQLSTGQDSTGQFQPSGPGRSWVEYPYDYMFLTGQYPPGTISHFSSSFEQGRDNWQDTQYIRDYYPADPSTQQVKTYPADFGAPQSVKQPSQHVQQSIGSTSYGQSGAVTGQNQPYRAVGLPGYLLPARFEHQGSPAGGYGMSKAGY